MTPIRTRDAMHFGWKRWQALDSWPCRKPENFQLRWSWVSLPWSDRASGQRMFLWRHLVSQAQTTLGLQKNPDTRPDTLVLMMCVCRVGVQMRVNQF